MRILGIDPGSAITGYGVVEARGARLRCVAHGTLAPPRCAELPARLAALHAALQEVIGDHAPDGVVVEQVFVAASPRSALVLGQARGVALAAAAASGLPVYEYGPRTIKLAVAGSGVAAKAEVQRMVEALLALGARPVPDAADALAAAICHLRAAALPRGAARGRSRSRGRRAPRFALRMA
ncbi:MAG TPA: crossover junction endodeoxyribonuclease RuvC [Myxococcota bacterium]|nr:crossover junction endodeoxyribonuclease RuvC [Myxococcota bacterium]